MADHRQPTYRIAITGPEGRRVAELFPAVLFPGGQGQPDRYRVRVDRAWHRPGGLKYCFLPLAEALVVAGWPRPDLPAPTLTRGCRVRIPNGHVGQALYDTTWTATDPFQGPDGRWWVFVIGRRQPVLVDARGIIAGDLT